MQDIHLIFLEFPYIYLSVTNPTGKVYHTVNATGLYGQNKYDLPLSLAINCVLGSHLLLLTFLHILVSGIPLAGKTTLSMFQYLLVSNKGVGGIITILSNTK